MPEMSYAWLVVVEQRPCYPFSSMLVTFLWRRMLELLCTNMSILNKSFLKTFSYNILIWINFIYKHKTELKKCIHCVYYQVCQKLRWWQYPTLLYIPAVKFYINVLLQILEAKKEMHTSQISDNEDIAFLFSQSFDTYYVGFIHKLSSWFSNVCKLNYWRFCWFYAFFFISGGIKIL